MSQLVSIHQQLLSQLLSKYDKVMYLKIFISGSNNLKNMYYAAVNKHNNSLLNNKYIDAGFDLFLPEHEDPNEYDKWGDTICFFGTGWDVNPVNKIDFKIKCSAQMICDSGKSFSTGFYMYPRSSLSKTKLRLANSTGIVDSGYRGNLIGMFDVVNVNENLREKDIYADYYAKVNDRLLQICAPCLVPIYVEIVEDIYELDISTERGEGGFGSTGN
jgi:dUTPase